jgi:hypothetical protein
MTNERENSDELRAVTVRICPACGVVNPAGPSDTCPHLQLVRFQGIDDELSELLAKLATVRNEFQTLVTALRTRVMNAARSGVAVVEVTHKGRVSEVGDLRKRPKPLTLSNPEPAKPAAASAPKRKTKKPATPKSVDPRQLTLISREPPQGDA